MTRAGVGVLAVRVQARFVTALFESPDLIAVESHAREVASESARIWRTGLLRMVLRVTAEPFLPQFVEPVTVREEVMELGSVKTVPIVRPVRV